MARLIAKRLNCEKPKNGEPCDTCESCREIREGRSLDVIEIDAASNRGIDEIRELRERVKFAPSKGSYRTYVIDECLTADHHITLADGRVKSIAEIKNGDMVASVDLATGAIMSKKVSNWFFRYTDECIVIRTPQGRLSSTPTHRLWVIRDGAFTLTTAEEVRKTDHLLSPTFLPHVQRNLFTPEQLSLLALIQCDGHISKDSATIQIEVSKDIEYFSEKFSEGAKSWNKENQVVVKTTSRGTALFRCYSSTLKEQLLALGCPQGKKSGLIDVPDEVFQAPLESIRAYIDTCFCCEGDATYTPSTRLYKLSFTSVSECFAKKLQLLLKKFGIASSIMKIEKKNKNHQPAYRLNITGYDLRIFQKSIGLSMERKAKVISGQLLHKEKQDGIPIQTVFIGLRKELVIPHSLLQSRGVYLDKTQALTRKTVEEFIEIAQIPEYTPFLRFRYEKILAIERKKERTQVYDFTVPQTHTFIADGLCSSNCHMLTKEAFNALLKTLEEPPAHAIFILATTEVERVPATILSRVQRFDFRRVSLKDMVARLHKLAEGEGMTVAHDALELIALHAEGSLRDAETLLGKVLAGADKRVSREDVGEVLGLVNMESVSTFVGHLGKRDASRAIAHVNEMYEKGYDLAEFTKALVGYLRHMLILQLDTAMEKIYAVELTSEHNTALKAHSGTFPAEELIRMIRAFVTAGNEMKYATLPQLPLELAIVELTQPASKKKTESV